MILEWSGFGGLVLGTYFYGSRGVSGPLVSGVSAAILVIWGLMAGVYSASIANIVFTAIHAINFIRMKTDG